MDWVTLLGTVASVASLGYAWTQGIRLYRLRRRKNAEVWVALRTITSVLDALDNSPARKHDLQVAIAHGKVIELYRQLLNHAIQDERRFDETTIANWRVVGKLRGDWQEAQARQVLQTDIIRLPSASGRPTQGT